MLDLVCRRYPGRRPSDYLDLDEYTAFKFDTALAMRQYLQEKDEKMDMLEAILTDIENVARSMGAKIKKRPKRKRLIENAAQAQSTPHVNQLLQKLGGPGTKIEIQ